MFEWEDEQGRTPMIVSIENGHQDVTVAVGICCDRICIRLSVLAVAAWGCH